MRKGMFDDLDKEEVSDETNSIKVEKRKEEKISASPFNEKVTVVIYSEKGKGKTTAAYLLTNPKDKIFVVSGDGQSKIIAEQFFSKRDIEVYNAEKYDMIVVKKLPNGNYESIISMQAGDKNAQELIIKLQELEANKYDFIIIDGVNRIEQNLAEAVMRYKHFLQISDGVTNLSWWRERSNYINFLFDICLKKAKKGVIYTLYPKVVIKKKIEGEAIEQDEFPNYAADLMYKTQVVLRINSKKIKGEQKYLLDVISSKLARIKTGDEIDYTGKNLCDLIEL